MYKRRRSSIYYGGLYGHGAYTMKKFKRDVARGAKVLQKVGKAVVPRGSFSRLGGLAGNYLLPGVGGNAGSALGDVVSKLVGFGDYQVQKNSIVQNQLDMGQPVAAFGNLDQATRIRHREYVTDIVIPSSPGSFNLDNYFINPGLAKTFPWLSQIANNYQQYELLGCVFEFVSTASEAFTSSLALGSLIMASDYDTIDQNYSNKLQMENAQYSCATKPSNNLLHPIECAKHCTSTPVKYVRSGAIQANPANGQFPDQRLYDHANFQIATVNLPSGSTGAIGELWISYDIALYKPILNLGGDILEDQWTWDLEPSGASNLIAANTLAAKSTNSIGLKLGNTGGPGTYSLDVIFPRSVSYGCYRFVIWIKSTNSNVTNIWSQATVISNCTLNRMDTLPNGGPEGLSFPDAATATGTYTQVATYVDVTVDAPGASQASFSVPMSAAMPGVTGHGYLLCTQISPQQSKVTTFIIV